MGTRKKIVSEDVSKLTDMPKKEGIEVVVTHERVQPIVVNSTTFDYTNKVGVMNTVTGKIICAAVDKNIAENLVKSNTNFKIVDSVKK